MMQIYTLAATSLSEPLGIIISIVMLFFYVGIIVLIISFLIRVVRYFNAAGKEQKRLRMEVGKLADEVQQIHSELKAVAEKKGGE